MSGAFVPRGVVIIGQAGARDSGPSPNSAGMCQPIIPALKRGTGTILAIRLLY